ncbi:NUDIX hydrolase [Salinicola tamaricis]|uniref:NUDIX hydrolase n=1 Tax=Salinicola tamaricis TaxID=1771309 RepID=UPI000D0A493F|nr:NUDIX domain-containing protein [Salinicola tamaricis]
MEVRYCSRLMLVNEQNALLLFQYQDEHTSSAFWATAGGELKPGESYLQAASRELYEETGLREEIGPLVMEREAVFAVARSQPALWRERYYLVRCPKTSQVFAADWTDEEKATIQRWKWWSREAMRAEGRQAFKPENLIDLLADIIESKPAK